MFFFHEDLLMWGGCRGKKLVHRAKRQMQDSSSIKRRFSDLELGYVPHKMAYAEMTE